MKRLNAFLVSVLATVALNAAEANTAVIEQVIVRQQWPWSTDVKIEYRLKDVSSPVDVTVEAYNGDEKLDQSRLDESLSGDRFGVTDVVGTIILDPVKAFGTEKVALANFKVKLSLSPSSADSQDVLYKILDLTDFTTKDVRRCDFQNGKMGAYETDFGVIGEGYKTSLEDVLIWTGITNMPEYKLTKLAMRRIPAKGVTYKMGANPNDYSKRNTDGYHDVTLTNDFYISVFEVTEKQAKLLTSVGGVSGEIPTVSSGWTHADNLPVGKTSYNWLRGRPQDYINWPNDIYEVGASSALQKIRDNFPGLLFDLATEAQWEYACRAGTTNQLYNGKYFSGQANAIANLESLAWYSRTVPDEQHQLGGQKRPNAFGLYDMYGNQLEICRDLVESSEPTAITTAQTEPIGTAPVTEDYRDQWAMVRGAYYKRDYAYPRSAMRGLCEKAYGEQAYYGFRLWLRAE